MGTGVGSGQYGPVSVLKQITGRLENGIQLPKENVGTMIGRLSEVKLPCDVWKATFW